MFEDNDFEEGWAKPSLFGRNPVCDECCRPLIIYGYRPRLICDEKDGFVFNEFCFECAEELGVRETDYSKRADFTQEPTFIVKQKGSDNYSDIHGMQKMTCDVLKSLALGMTEKEVLEKYPYLSHQDILACYEFAAQRI